MRVRYFQETGIFYIEFKPAEVSETRNLDENTILDLDQAGNICRIVEHAGKRADVPVFSFEQVAC